LGHSLALGLLAGKFAADEIFSLLPITCYELKNRLLVREETLKACVDLVPLEEFML